MDIYSVIQNLIDQAVAVEMIQKEDAIYSRNQLLAVLELDSFKKQEENISESDIPALLEKLEEYAAAHGLIQDMLDEKEIFSSKVMNVFMPRPSDLNRAFFEKYSRNPESATKFYYQLSRNSNYIQTKRIAKNISYKVETQYGELDITINLSKPEKDPKEIALERERKATASSHYPKCLLCVENEGYEGRIGHPARSNHRMIRMKLKDEDWYFQYSPYVYYNEHCILLSGEHRDMKINRDSFARLLDFVEQFPHYFAGSNADLPIVGGSILSHDHYQGGNYDFAMAKAEDEYRFTLSAFPSVMAATIKWPMSVIRLRGSNITELADAAEYILEKWIPYTDIHANLIAYTGETRHNTITPIARYKDGHYELDLVLRNNRTNEQHPMGIFHPHQDAHHIKKENIGLIEVMGLAVLPARLKSELAEVEKYLLRQENNLNEYHLAWADDMLKRYGSDITPDSVNGIVQKEVGYKFLRVLEDACVFKRNSEGQEAFLRFMQNL